MEIKRVGSQPLRKVLQSGSLVTVRIDPLFRAHEPALFQGLSLLSIRARRTAGSLILSANSDRTAGCGGLSAKWTDR